MGAKWWVDSRLTVTSSRLLADENRFIRRRFAPWLFNRRIDNRNALCRGMTLGWCVQLRKLQSRTACSHALLLLLPRHCMCMARSRTGQELLSWESPKLISLVYACCLQPEKCDNRHRRFGFRTFLGDSYVSKFHLLLTSQGFVPFSLCSASMITIAERSLLTHSTPSYK